MATLYKIIKIRKADRRKIGFLSPKMARWVSVNSDKHKPGKWDEHTANGFLKQHENDPEYYYLKTVS